MAAAEFKAIQKLLFSGRKTAKKNQLWTHIHEQTGAGVIVGGVYTFTTQEIQRLRQFARHLTGLDPQTDDIAGSRMEMARKTNNEKLARDPVYGSLFVMAVIGDAEVIISGQRMKPPAGTLISALPETLDTEDLKNRKLVIVENGGVMPSASKIIMPPEWSNSVLLYRGHGSNQGEVNKIVAAQPSHNLALYYDFDPKGLDMAMSHGKGSVLIPQQWQTICETPAFLKDANKRGAFRDQHESMKRLQAMSDSPLWRTIVDAMRSKEVSITQEHITVYELPLVSVERNNVARTNNHQQAKEY